MAQVEYIKKQRLSPKRAIWGLIAALLLFFSAVFLLFYPFASTAKKAYFHGVNPILYNGAQQGNALIEGNTLFVPYSFLKKNLDSSITFDEQSKSVIITTKDKVIKMPTNSLTYFVNQKPVKLQLSPIISKNGEVFVALDSILSFYPIQYKKLPESNAIWIQKDGENYQNGRIIAKEAGKEWLRLRISPSVRTPYTADTKNNEAVIIEGEKNGFYLVQKANGISGYIKKDYVKREDKVNIHIARDTKSFKLPKINGPVHLTWEAVYTKNPDPAKIPNMQGVNVVSPTWFSLANKGGLINNRASLAYSKWAHQKGYQVWGLFSNSFDPELTYQTLKNFDTRQAIIQQLLTFSKMYQLQGINFDIENVNEEDGPLVTQLVREAAPYFHEAGLVVSMDITFASGDHNNWSSFFERTKLAQITDYMIVMAYDEHTSAATGAGSAASLPWVEANLKHLLTEVPHDKLVLGIPLYSILWKEQTNADGSQQLSIQTLSMDMVKAWLNKKGLKPTFDKKSGQNYAEYYAKNEDATYKIWIEDEMSLKKRAELAAKYDLAGIASWSRTFGDQTAWTALDLSPDKNITKK
jgi:spore germination protein YaaH